MGAGGEPNAGFLPASKRITDAPWLRVALGRYEKGRTRFDVLSAHDVLAAALDPVKPVGSHDVGAAAARHRVAVAVANENLVAARPADDDVPTRAADEHLGARAAEKAVAAASAVSLLSCGQWGSNSSGRHGAAAAMRTSLPEPP
jgi:hypothetical protein